MDSLSTTLSRFRAVQEATAHNNAAIDLLHVGREADTHTPGPWGLAGYVRATLSSLPRWVLPGAQGGLPPGPPSYCTY